MVVLAVVVIGGVLLTRKDGNSGGPPIQVTQASVSYPTTVDGQTIVAGNPAPHTLEIYEDALCPACQQFEQQSGDRIAQAVAGGQLQVRYHLVNLLEQRSNPPGYSTAAGNAMMCAAGSNAFPTVHTSLYGAQPREGGTGYTTEQLIGLGQAAGAGPGYADCVTSGRYAQVPRDNLQSALANPALQRNGSFGTPTLVLDGRTVTNGSDLSAVLGG